MDPATIMLIVEGAQEVLPLVIALVGAVGGLAVRGLAATVDENVLDETLGKSKGIVKALAGNRGKANK